MELVLETRGLTKKFGKIVAVDDLDLKVYRGDVFGFLGPNGAGKSTTIRMLTTLINPDKGEILLFNQKLTQNSKHLLKKVGAIVESPDFYLYLTAYKNLEILSRLYGIEVTKKNIMEILDFVGLAERWNSKVKTFSHGMKQRLGIAQALLHDPDLIILDEPTTGLDPYGMREIRDLIKSLSQEKKKTIFLSSHILSEIEQVANRMIILNKGKKVVEGEVKELLYNYNSNFSFVLSNYNKAIEVLKKLNFVENTDFKLDKNELIIKTIQFPAFELNKIFIQNGIDVYSFSARKTLEEFFLKLTYGIDE